MLIASLLGALVVSFTPTTGAVAADRTMSIKRAGNYYQRTACALNQAGDRFDRTVGNPRSYAEIRRRLPELHRASDRLGQAFYRYGNRLFGPPNDWPSRVSGPVRLNARAAIRAGNVLAIAAQERSPRAWFKEFQQVVRKARDMGNTSAQIRSLLRLPPRSRGCD